MDIKIDYKNELEAVLTVNLQPADYKERYENSLKKTAKQVAMPGFRQGMVPRSLVEKKYGRSILFDELNEVVNSAISNYVKDNKLGTLGQPLPNEEKQAQLNLDEMGDFEFVFDLGLAPKVNPVFDSKDQLLRYKISVTDKMVEDELSRIRRQFGKLQNSEVITENDHVYGEFIELAENGEPLEGGVSRQGSLLVSTIKDEAVKADFVGKKAEDTLHFDIFKVFDDNHTVIGQTLGLQKEAVADLNPSFRFVVKGCITVVPAELDEQLFNQLFPGKDLKTEADFRQALIEDISNYFNNTAERELDNDVVEMAVKKYPLTLPEDFLKRWLKATRQEEMSEQAIERQFNNEAQSLRWSILFDSIIESQQLEIPEEEVIAAARGYVADLLRQRGEQVTPDVLQQYVQGYLSKQENVSRMFDVVKSQKAIDYIKTLINIAEKEVSLEEYNQIIQAKRPAVAHDHHHDHDHDHDHEHHHHDHAHDHQH